MLTTLFVAIFAKLMPVFHLDVVNNRFDAFLATLLLFVVIYILFRIGAKAFAKEKAVSRYEDIYEEPVIRFIQIVYVVTAVLTIIRLFNNISNGVPTFDGTFKLFAMLVVLDIVNVIAGFKLYSFDVKEAIIDSFLIQVKNLAYSFIILAIILAILKFTIFGFVLIACIVISIFIRK